MKKWVRAIALVLAIWCGSMALLPSAMAESVNPTLPAPTVNRGNWGRVELCFTYTGEAKSYAWLLMDSLNNLYAIPHSDLGKFTGDGITAYDIPGRQMLLLTVETGKADEYTAMLQFGSALTEKAQFRLLDGTKLKASIDRARSIANNPNTRYTDSYIKDIRTALSAAEALYNTPAPSAEAIDNATAALNKALGRRTFAGTGIAFIDRFLLPYMDGIWNVIDTLAAPLRWAKQKAGAVGEILAEAVKSALGF